MKLFDDDLVLNIISIIYIMSVAAGVWTLADAVVDLFVCAGAEEFMGSAHSSFSELVMHLRELR